MAFEFKEDTAFDGHKDSSPAPRRRGGRRSSADSPKADPAPEAETPRFDVETAPEAAPPPAAGPPARKPGLPRTGKYKPRKYKPERWGKGKKYGASGEWVPGFLKAYARTGNISQAAYVAGVARQTVLNWREKDPDFAEAAEDAFEWHKAQFDDEARRRAMEGDDIVVWDKARGEWVEIKQKNPLYFFFYGKKINPEYRDNYKAEDRDGAQAAIQVLVNVLEEGKRLGSASPPGKPALPSFDDFPVIDVTPAETKDERRARLLAELAKLDEEQGSDVRDVPGEGGRS